MSVDSCMYTSSPNGITVEESGSTTNFFLNCGEVIDVDTNFLLFV